MLCAWLAAGLVSLASGYGLTFPRIGVRSLTTGGESGGGLLGLPTAKNPRPEPTHVQFPFTLAWPSSPLGTMIVAVPLSLVWYRFAVRPLRNRLNFEARHLGGMPRIERIRAELGAARARRAGKLTMPGFGRLARVLLPTSAFGYFLGYPRKPRAQSLGLWANWENRVRIIARTGWGKTSRLLVRNIRNLPGPTMVASIEPKIFEQTVTARQFRRRPLRWPLLGALSRPWRPVLEFPVAVLDFSAPETRFAAGYPRVRWDLIPGCERYAVAKRRASGLVCGVESENPDERGSSSDKFFRDSATSVLGAWLHAAALGRRTVDDMAEWLKDISDPLPRTILTDNAGADRTAALALDKHLSEAAKGTTSGVERYLTLAMESLLTDEGHELISGHRGRGGVPLPQFDMRDFIAKKGTLYILADPELIETVRPLLSMVANEMFIAAQDVALSTRARILPEPFTAVIDELRHGVTISILPYVANTLRKHNIGYMYSVQASSQEDAIYGKEANALRAAAGVTVYGGIDMDSARETSERAGPTPVVTATRGTDVNSEHIQFQDVLTIADQQELEDGEAIVIRPGLRPFIAYVPSIYEQRRTNRTIRREADAVAKRVEMARAGELAGLHSHSTAASAGAVFTTPIDDPSTYQAVHDHEEAQ